MDLVSLTILCTNDGLLEALLAEVGEDIIGGAGRVASIRVETGVSKHVAKVLEDFQQLLRGILVDGQDLGREHVVDHEEGLLRVGLGTAKSDHVFTG